MTIMRELKYCYHPGARLRFPSHNEPILLSALGDVKLNRRPDGAAVIQRLDNADELTLFSNPGYLPAVEPRF